MEKKLAILFEQAYANAGQPLIQPERIEAARRLIEIERQLLYFETRLNSAGLELSGRHDQLGTVTDIILDLLGIPTEKHPHPYTPGGPPRLEDYDTSQGHFVRDCFHEVLYDIIRGDTTTWSGNRAIDDFDDLVMVFRQDLPKLYALGLTDPLKGGDR